MKSNLFLPQTQDFQFLFAYHRKEVDNVDEKSKFCPTLVEMFQFLANCKPAAIFQFRTYQLMK